MHKSSHTPNPDSLKGALNAKYTMYLDTARMALTALRRTKRTLRKLRKLGKPTYSYVYGNDLSGSIVDIDYHRPVASMYDMIPTLEFLEGVFGECTDVTDSDNGNRCFRFRKFYPKARVTVSIYAIPDDEKESKDGRRCRKVLLKTIEEREVTNNHRNIYAIICD